MGFQRKSSAMPKERAAHCFSVLGQRSSTDLDALQAASQSAEDFVEIVPDCSAKSLAEICWMPELPIRTASSPAPHLECR